MRAASVQEGFAPRGAFALSDRDALGQLVLLALEARLLFRKLFAEPLGRVSSSRQMRDGIRQRADDGRLGPNRRRP